MNILLIHQAFLPPNSGGGSRFNEMTRLWEEKGNKVTVLAGQIHYHTGELIREDFKGKYTVKEQISEGRNVIWCHMSSGYAKNFFGRLISYFSFVWWSTWAGLFVAREKYDIILVSSPPLFVAFTAWILSFFKRTPLVFEVRDLWPESAIDVGALKNKFIIWLMYRLEAFIYWWATLITVVTPAFEKTLVEQKGIPKEKILLLPNGSDFSISEDVLKTFDRDAFRAEMGWEDKVVIIYIGAHGVAGHLIQVVQTAELLKEEHPEVLFVLVGDGMQKPMLKKEVKQRGLKNVEFHDHVPKRGVFEFIAGSDFGASVLRRADTFKTVYSNKTFDYLSCKKPILMVIDGVSRELVEQVGCGVYIEPEEPEDFAAKIRDYLIMPREEWQAQGERGYAYALKHFDRTVLAYKYLDRLHEMI